MSEIKLANSVSAEGARAIAAEILLSNSVSTEGSRAVAAEVILANSVSTEGSRAKATEGKVVDYVNGFMTGANKATLIISQDFTTATLSVSATATLDQLVAGSATIYSDVRLKKDVEDVLDATAKVNALHPVFYNWKEKPSMNADFKELGFIAQEVEAVLPNIVRTLDDAMGTKTVAYDRLVSLLVAALKEHDIRITALENK